MDHRSKKLPSSQSPATDTPDRERRRLGRIVHDDRGNASVEWRDAPADYERPVFEIQDAPLSIKSEETFNPYERPHAAVPARKTGTQPRKDLRKLSEWIKMMRELEERKKRGED